MALQMHKECDGTFARLEAQFANPQLRVKPAPVLSPDTVWSRRLQDKYGISPSAVPHPMPRSYGCDDGEGEGPVQLPAGDRAVPDCKIAQAFRKLGCCFGYGGV